MDINLGALSHLLITDTFKSHLEMSPWELLPGALMLLFASFGVAHFYSEKKKTQVYSQRQRAERSRISLPLKISTPVTQEFSVLTYDISLTGAFLPYDELKNSMAFTSLVGKRSGIKVGDLVDIQLITGRFSHITCQARVVRYNFSDDTLPPKGIGIEFIQLSKKSKRVLANIIQQEETLKAA